MRAKIFSEFDGDTLGRDSVKYELRGLEDEVKFLRERKRLKRMDLEMERIAGHIESDLRQSYSDRDQGMLVAEFTMLDNQVYAPSHFLVTCLIDAPISFVNWRNTCLFQV